MSTVYPVYGLYGEKHSENLNSGRRIWMHYETIKARSSVHNWTIRPHQHADLRQLFYLRGGECSFELRGTQRALRLPCVIDVPAGIVHGFRFSPNISGYVVTTMDHTIDAQTPGTSKQM